MTTYRYKGISSSGAPMEGIVQAFDRQDALIKARENCRILSSLEPVSGDRLRILLNTEVGVLISGGKFKAKELALLCSQLAIEMNAGLPLVSSLRLAAQNAGSRQLKTLLEEVAEDVQAGNRLADSFALRGPGLPNTFIETLRAGEESGTLDETFRRMRKYYADADAAASRVSSALIYPCMLLFTAALVIGIILVFAVPVFVQSFGDNLPLPTRILVTVSGFLARHWLVLAALITAGVLGILLWGKTAPGHRLYARLALTFPGIRLVNRMHAAAQFAATLSTMLSAGLPLVQACTITGNVSGNPLIREDIEAAVRGVIEGKTLAEGLKKSKWFPQLLVEMVTVGEQTGKLEETLRVVRDHYHKEVDTAVKQALEILNPCITIVLSLIVVFILLSVYLPVFRMY